ncbi:phage virion morphogenesis protein [Vibrio sp. Of7-15]|uniref:phage virion morphogenesis protein n=1 Tax=Vibrio sp. Of7-15 TaxID=2724879 RepID=UPI001EF33FF1|nr:phage virion morphogenesis protein [Vibrio sp. Of7-15]MCG7499369.1 phage virion morphogenesis protein [Vibrio sp. Of7-15]
MIKINVDKQSEVSTKNWLKSLMMTKPQRKKALQKIAQANIRKSRANRFRQKDPDGQVWKKRKRQPSRQMQASLGRFIGVTQNNGHTATISWRNRRSAQVAYIHHHGVRLKGNRAQAINALNAEKTESIKTEQGDTVQGCTKHQALKLRRLGFSIWSARLNPKAPKGKRTKPNATWIYQHVSMQEASVALRHLKGNEGKSTWDIPMPKRPFVEVNHKVSQKATMKHVFGQQ